MPAVIDEMETSTIEHERHVAFDARSRKASVLAELNDALVRFRAGAYGVCEECREPISPGRLQALPGRVFVSGAGKSRASRANRA